MTTRPRRKPRKADNAQHTEAFQDRALALEAIARRIHAEWEAGFPAFTRQTWEQLMPHPRLEFLVRAMEELEGK